MDCVSLFAEGGNVGSPYLLLKLFGFAVVKPEEQASTERDKAADTHKGISHGLLEDETLLIFPCLGDLSRYVKPVHIHDIGATNTVLDRLKIVVELDLVSDSLVGCLDILKSNDG